MHNFSPKAISNALQTEIEKKLLIIAVQKKYSGHFLMMIKRCFLYIRAFSKEKSQLFNIFYEFLTYSHNYTNTHTTVYHPFSPKQPLFFSDSHY